MTETLGKRLVSYRQQKGLTVEEIAQITRISLRLIHAAEADRFEELPGAVFTKGFLRSYAKVVGADGSDLVRKFESLGMVEVDKSPKLISMPLHNDYTRSSMMVFIVATLISVTLLGLYLFGVKLEIPWTGSGQPTAVAVAPAKEKIISVEPELEIPKEIDSAPSVEEAGVNTAITDEAVIRNHVEKIEEASTDLKPAPGAPFSLSLKLIAISDTWIKVVIDKETTREIILRGGKSVTWMAKNEYLISIGNVAGTRLFLNGEEIALKQPFSNVLSNLIIPPPGGGPG